MKKKHLGIELLRIVAMVMVVILHYLNKGQVLRPIAQNFSGDNLCLWLLEAFAIVSTNVYMLITGYLLVDASWKPNRFWRMIGQVYFYGLLIPVALLLIGAVTWQELSVYDWLQVLLPVAQESYWYITAYVLLLFFAPLLASGAKALTKKQFQWVLGGLLFFFSVEKTLVPIALTTDGFGYDYGWLLCLFLVAAYIRLHGITWLEKERNAWCMFVCSCIGIWGISLMSAFLGNQGLETFGKYYVSMPYTHNYLLSLTGAVGMFYGFLQHNWEKALCQKKGWGAKLVYGIAPCTLGIYLLHEHPMVRYRWQGWLQVSLKSNLWLQLGNLLFSVFVIFACGILIELLRSWLFQRIAGLLPERRRQ